MSRLISAGDNHHPFFLVCKAHSSAILGGWYPLKEWVWKEIRFVLVGVGVWYDGMTSLGTGKVTE